MDAGLLVAREGELEAIRALLRGDGAGARALILEGDPGVGKTSLWERGVAWAREDGRRVLVARASEDEGGLPFAGLIDVFDAVASEELGSVPAPQVRALDVALYRADPTDRPPEAQVISLAVLSALRALSEGERVLVAIDDLQWLDSASEEAVAYAARRLHAEPVTFLFARRPGRRTAVEKAFPDEQLARVDVGAISLGATRQILASRLGLRLPHHLLRRVYETTTGNPLFAIEVGRMLAARDLDALGNDLPVPEHVEEVLGLRVADLEDPAGRVLLTLALDADVRVPQVHDLFGPAALRAAVDAGVVTVEGERVRAAHPLLAAAAKRQARAEDAQELHRRLAEVVADEQRRALHLALATTEPDEELARRLDAAAARAAARGSTRLAVDMGAHALRLTPPGTSDVDRVLALGRHLEDAGDKERLTELLAARVESLPRGAARVQAYTLLTEGVVRGNADIRGLLEKALAEAGDDPTLRAQVLPFLAEHEAVDEVRQVARADDRATEAVALSELGSADDQALAVHSLTWTQALRGRPVAHLVERYHALTPQRSYMARHPERVAGQRLTWRGELAQARALIADYRDRAEEWAEAYALARLHLCELELRAGGWSDVERMLDEWAESTDNDLLQWPMYERCRALLAAGRGDVEGARRWGSGVVSQTESTGGRWDWLEANRALGVAALLDKDLAGAVGHLGAVWDHTQQEGVLDPGAFPVGPDLVEALVETEAYDAAQAVVDVLAERAREQEHPWAGAGAQRGAALAEIHGDAYTDAAGAELEAAAATYGRLGLAFDEARTLFALGRAQRRAKKWGAARDVLERAVAAFSAIGSPGWAADARAELARVGARKPATSGGLTATERRVADLAVEGLANKEIARTLVVTVNTVEFHLRNAYAKLGIRSRVQLAARLQEVDGPVPEADPHV
jgi:DNA-binding CsgD family transcriptional regulator